MLLAESVRIAWLGLAANKLRSVLTMLGVIIGVAAVITLVSVGEGGRQQITDQVKALGSNLITVIPQRQFGGRILLSDLPDLKERVPGVLEVVGSVTAASTLVRSEAAEYTTTVEGAGHEMPAVRDRTLALGQFFTEEDVRSRRPVAVLGATVVGELFGAEASPIGRTVRLLGQSFTVVGVLEKKGVAFGQDLDDRVFVPVTVAQRLLGTNRLAAVYIQIARAEDSPQVVAQLQDVFQRKLRAQNAVRVQSQEQILATVDTIAGTLTLMLGSIAGISLLVGGIGIMNIMLVSVTERTREIGIRKAVGARRRDIALQFLVEALCISVAGGLLGISLGLGGAGLLSTRLNVPTVVTGHSIALAFVFSAAVGVFFGLYPAVRAGNLDPIEALRRE